MSFNKILSAATEAFKQNFSTMCRNSDNMVRKIDNETFNRMVIMLMDAARAAGVAGLEEYLIVKAIKSSFYLRQNISFSQKIPVRDLRENS